MSDASTLLSEQCDVSIEPSRGAGGQHVGCDPGIMVVTHRESGISIRLPPQSSRSQHKRRQAALDAIEYLLEAG